MLSAVENTDNCSIAHIHNTPKEKNTNNREEKILLIPYKKPLKKYMCYLLTVAGINYQLLPVYLCCLDD